MQYSHVISRNGLCKREDGLVCLGLLLEAVYKDIVDKTFVKANAENVSVYFLCELIFPKVDLLPLPIQ